MNPQDVKNDLIETKLDLDGKLQRHEDKISQLQQDLNETKQKVAIFEVVNERLEKTVDNSCNEIQRFSDNLKDINFKDLIDSQKKSKWDKLIFGIGIGVSTPIAMILLRFIASLLVAS